MEQTMNKNRTEILDYVNALKGYQGYVQFSNRRIEEIFTDFSDITVDPGEGFIYEAHFYNGSDSISIRQINVWWYVDETKDVSIENTQMYYAINNLKVKMAQIWEAENDPLCEDLPVLKLKKVVFAGFEGGKQ
jgi:CRISPR type III-associated protein (TIGR04423 family)